MEVEHGTFTPLVFSATGGAGRECRKFFRRLAGMISDKKKSEYSSTVTWLFRKVNFSLMKALHVCIRGSRTAMPKKRDYDPVFNPDVSEAVTRI